MGVLGVFVLKSGLTILIQAPQLPFLVPQKRQKWAKHVDENLADGGLAGRGATRHPDQEGSPQSGRSGSQAGTDMPLMGHPVLDWSFVIPYNELVLL